MDAEVLSREAIEARAAVPEECDGHREAGLLLAARAGDPDAFVSLVRLHDVRMRALVWRLLEDRDAMDDALQEAYLKAFRGLSGMRGDARFGTWLYRIVYNTCIDLIRARCLEHPVAPDDPTVTALEDGRPTHVELYDLERAVRALPPELKAVVVLVHVQDMPYAEVARALGIRVGTVGSRLNRAHALLRGSFETDAEKGGSR